MLYSDKPLTPRDDARAGIASAPGLVKGARALRPWMQAAQFLALREAGEKLLVGRNGWFFYQPGVGFLTQRPKSRDTTPRDALAAVLHFRDQLASRGLRLLVMPAPNKESIYPEMLTRLAAAPGRIIGVETRSFLAQCENAGVEVVDLFALYRGARQASAIPLYLAQDSHWSPAGMELAAAAVADRILARGWLTRGPVSYNGLPRPVQRVGDLARMLRSPEIEKRIAPETAACTQIMERDIERPDGIDDCPSPTVHGRADVEPLPESFDIQGVLSDEDVCKPAPHAVRTRRLNTGASDPGIEVSLTDAGHTLIGMDLNHDVILG